MENDIASLERNDCLIFFAISIAASLFLLALAWIGFRQSTGHDTRHVEQETNAALTAPSDDEVSRCEASRSDDVCTTQRMTSSTSSNSSNTMYSLTTSPTVKATSLSPQLHSDVPTQGSVPEYGVRLTEKRLNQQKAGDKSVTLTSFPQSSHSRSHLHHGFGNTVARDLESRCTFSSSDAGKLQWVSSKRISSVLAWLQRKLTAFSLYLEAEESMFQKYLHAKNEAFDGPDYDQHKETQPKTQGQEQYHDDVDKSLNKELVTSVDVTYLQAKDNDVPRALLMNYCDAQVYRLSADLEQKRISRVLDHHDPMDFGSDQALDTGTQKYEESDVGSQKFQATAVGNLQFRASHVGGQKVETLAISKVKAREPDDDPSTSRFCLPSSRSVGRRMTDDIDLDDVRDLVNRPEDDHRGASENRTFVDKWSLCNKCNVKADMASCHCKGVRYRAAISGWGDQHSGGQGTRDEWDRNRSVVTHSNSRADGRDFLIASSKDPHVDGRSLLVFCKHVTFALVTCRFPDLTTAGQLVRLLFSCVCVHLLRACAACPFLAPVLTCRLLLRATARLDLKGVATHLHSLFLHFRLWTATWMRAAWYVLRGNLLFLLLDCAREVSVFSLVAAADVIARLSRSTFRAFNDIRQRVRRCFLWAVIRPLVGAALCVCDVLLVAFSPT